MEKKIKEGIHLKKKKRFVKQKISGKIFVLMGLAIILAIAAYTFILQSAYTKTALETEISRDRASADAVHKLVDGKIGGEDFSQIKDRSDEETQFYKDISCYLNEIRTLNSTRYIYIATRDEEGKLIYVVDGLDPDAGDVRHPGDYIEDEMVPYIERALSGENVYSQDIVDTTWGPIFTACYPVRSNLDGTGDIVGAFCMEMDMQSAYGMVVKTNKISVICGTIVGLVLMMICLSTYFIYQKSKEEERKQKQLLLEAAEKADAANQAKSTFLLNMSHDIRTPMNAIVGLTAIAGANIESQDRVIECLSKITKSSRHLLGLINEVLDMARIESGKMTLAQEDFNLPDLVDNLITLTKPVIDEHKHNLDIHINHIEHESVCGDSLRIQQVFVNLMSNAIKYTPDGGNITFSIEEKPNGFSELGCYEFTIEDNGIGMSPEFQKIMFDPFSRADDHRTTRVQGTGLGMAISRNIVNLMNGTIKVDSTLHKGTKITVTIYLELQEKEKEQDRDLMNLPVLVVDDDRTCCESTVATLKEIGIMGEWVLSGREAIECCYARHELKDDYFAVILDWKMPDMDGIETARQIRKRIGKEITIIVLTSYEFSEIEEEAKAAGIDAFIAKPLFRSRLTATLRQFTSGRKEKTARNYLEKLSESDYTEKRILLVEDNELNREIGVEILQMTGAEVETAENGKIAVEKVEASPEGLYDLVFMDIQMPVMNGYEATAAIRSLPGEKGKLPIVAMTANAFAEDVQLAKNTGMNGHIAKPLDMNKLNDVLENWL